MTNSDKKGAFRRRFLIALGVVCLLFAGIVGWGYYESLTLVTSTYEIPVPEWKGTNKSMRVLLVADPHFRPGASLDTYRDEMLELISAINKADADVVLLLGDYTYGHSQKTGMNPAVYAQVLAERIKCRQIYAILGNHDTEYGRGIITDAFNKVGIPVIEGKTAFVTNREGNAEVQLMGVPDIYSLGANAVIKSLLPRRDAQTPAILMTHGPEADHLLPSDVNLVVAGHTHGGQICFPNGFPLVCLLKITPPPYQGLFQRSPDSQLVISRGIGFSILPLRIYCSPEIVLLKLKAGS